METCPNCTAPREAGLVACKFCNTPFVRDVATEAVQCLQCGTYSDIRMTNCVKCKAWVVVKCVFCSAVSPHHYPACVNCREPFAGAAERWQARQEAATSQERMQMFSSVGGVAAAFLGAAAGAALTGDTSFTAGKHGHGRRHHHHDDDSSSSSSGSWTDVLTGDSDNPGGGGRNLMDSDLTGGSDDNSSS